MSYGLNRRHIQDYEFDIWLAAKGFHVSSQTCLVCFINIVMREKKVIQSNRIDEKPTNHSFFFFQFKLVFEIVSYLVPFKFHLFFVANTMKTVQSPTHEKYRSMSLGYCKLHIYFEIPLIISSRNVINYIQLRNDSRIHCYFDMNPSESPKGEGYLSCDCVESN